MRKCWRDILHSETHLALYLGEEEHVVPLVVHHIAGVISDHHGGTRSV